MKISVSERRQIENEMIFRRMNEKVGFDLDSLDAMHIEDGNPHLVRSDDLLLQFMCECSDEKCEERIPLKLSEYKAIHLDRNTFIVKLRHQVDPIEKVVRIEPAYNIVKKNHSTPEPGEMLNETKIRNKSK